MKKTSVWIKKSRRDPKLANRTEIKKNSTFYPFLEDKKFLTWIKERHQKYRKTHQRKNKQNPKEDNNSPVKARPRPWCQRQNEANQESGHQLPVIHEIETKVIQITVSRGIFDMFLEAAFLLLDHRNNYQQDWVKNERTQDRITKCWHAFLWYRWVMRYWKPLNLNLFKNIYKTNVFDKIMNKETFFFFIFWFYRQVCAK